MRLLPALASVGLLSLVCLGESFAADAALQRGEKVAQSTRLDWGFVLANQSLATPPADWVAGYASAEQKYDVFVPPSARQPKSGWPLVLFISASDAPAGWSNLEAVCRKQGIVFASPQGAGNNAAMPKRVQLVLDVLDDLRRKQSIDPDRTYIAGFSGGGRVACSIAFALPEVFGGVIPVCAGGELRDEQWLRHRLTDRLSVALITGTNDFNRGEVERYRGPMFSEMGIRAQATVVPGLGHGIPNDKVFEGVLKWLDEGAADRGKLAARYPASRIAIDSVPTRAEAAQALLAEALGRLEKRETVFSGLMQLQGVRARWPDLPPAKRALAVLTKFEQQADRDWEQDDVLEQRRTLIARARAIDAYASGDLPAQYVQQRPAMLDAAIELWKQVLADGQNEAATAEATRRIPVLTEKLDAAKK